MPAFELNDVPGRVVAWHNRHPLAQRIHTDQVHSIGEVRLPFASALPTPSPGTAAAPRPPHPLDAAPVPAAPVETPVAAAASAAMHDNDAHTDAQAPDTDTTGVPAPDDPAAAEVELVITGLEPAAATATNTLPGADVPTLAARLQAARAAALSGTPTQPTDPAPASVPAKAAPPWWRRLWPGRDASPKTVHGPLRPLFDAKLLDPLKPGRVARWASRHGRLQPLATSGWPRRHEPADPRLLLQAQRQGHAHRLDLHLWTAAIEVGGQRLRVLLDHQGQVLGQRRLHRPRLAALAAALVAATAAAGWATRWPAPTRADRAEQVAVAPVGASGARVADAKPDAAPDAAAHAASDSASDSASDVARPALPAPAPTAPHPVDTPRPPAHGDAAPAASDPPPPAFPQRHASGPLVRLRPELSPEARLAARQQSEAARAAAAGHSPAAHNATAAPAATAATARGAAAPAARYALVSEGSVQREAAEARLAQMLAVRAQLPTRPQRTELLLLGGQWYATQWPYATTGDAERARGLLTARGLKAEVVPF
jgi:hypothetical protein